MGTVGFELNVFGLDHQNPDSACDHLVWVLNDLRNQHSFPPLNVQRGDATSALDYAFISLSSSLTGPCPDLLEDLCLLLNTLPDLRATWRLCNGPDHTCWVFFAFPSDNEAQSMLDPLHEWFQVWHMSIMAEQTTHPPSTSQTCISFNLFNGSDVDHIMREPPFIRGHTLHPGCPRFIIPLYGGEVAIGGVAGLGNVESSLNTHLCQQYRHNVIVGSQVKLEDDVYCIVFKDWPSTQAFLHDNQNGLPVQWFLYGVSVGKPTLLFSFNTQGAPPNLVSCSAPYSAPENIIQPQLDYFRSEFGHFTSTLNTMFDHISQVEQCLEQNNQTLLGMMSAQYLLGDYQMNLLLLMNKQDHLTAQCECYQDQLAASPDPTTHQRLQTTLKNIDDHCSAVSAKIEQLHAQIQAMCLSLSTHDHLILPVTPSPHIPVSVTSPSRAPSPSTSSLHPSHIRSCSPDDMGESHGLPRLHLQSVADSRWAPVADPGCGSQSTIHEGKQCASDDMIQVWSSSHAPYLSLTKKISKES
ncbi:hypothetical protein EDC04DRAFT_2971127 [Pisolithus marmoratus]|nr:hypothetical protein EDC04DRAFT_2971127 [Pisolithus marmoratus]